MGTEARQLDVFFAGSTKSDGSANNGGRIQFTATGTSTLQAVYSDKAKTAYTMDTADGAVSPDIDHVLLDPDGRPANGEIFMDGTYDIEVFDSDDVSVEKLVAATYEVPASASSIVAANKTTNFAVDGTIDVYFVQTGANVAANFDVGITVATRDAGTKIKFVKETSGNTLTITPAAGDTINGAATWTLDDQYEFCILEAKGSGTDWFVTSGASAPDAPSISDLSNMTHDHTDNTGGGLLDITPPGAVIAWAGTSGVPSGWLECDGSSQLRATYADLFTAISTRYGLGDDNPNTFHLPDLRGNFIRGYDNGAGVDQDAAARTASGSGGDSQTGDNIGTNQPTAVIAHTHAGVPATTSINQDQDGPSFAHISGTGSNTGAVNTVDTSATETRPINIYMMYIIKT